MTYTKKLDLTDPDYQALQGFFAQAETLEPGSRLTLNDFNPKQLDHIRWLIYNWLNHLGLKHLFKLKTDRDRGELVLYRKGLGNLGTKLDRLGLSSRLEEILKPLVGMEEKEVEIALHDLFVKKEVTLVESLEILEQWKKVMS